MKKEHIRSKIVELVPEIKDRACRNGNAHYCPNCDNSFGLGLTLADVLRAIREVRPKMDVLRSQEMEDKYGTKYHPLYWEQTLLSIWNLAKDLDGQTDEVWEFIGKILCVE